MKRTAFYKLGLFIYSWRKRVIALGVLLLLGCIPFVPNLMAPFKVTGFVAENSKSALTEEEINKALGYNKFNKLLIMYHSSSLRANGNTFNQKVKESLRAVKQFSLPVDIIYPDENKNQVGAHDAYAVIIIKSINPINEEQLIELKHLIKTPKQMSLLLGGEPVFIDEVNRQTENDLYKADFIATPVALITLLFVFGSAAAAVLPIVLGGGCALVILCTLYFLGHVFTLSVFTLNIALLLGLCLSLDYALFVICRFRDELNNNHSVEEAIAITQATAGKAILFSGLAVFVSLSALFFFPINILFSVAMGGMIAVFVAVFTAIIFLPAILSVLGQHINFISINLTSRFKEYSFWRWLASRVVKHPLVFFFPIVIFLLFLGRPFISAQFGVSDYKIFPEHSVHRAFFDDYSKRFNAQELTPIVLLVNSTHGDILEKKNLYRLYDLARNIQNMRLVKQVNSIVTGSRALSKAQYYQLYHRPPNADIKKMLQTTSSKKSAVLSIVSKYPAGSAQTSTLIKELSQMSVPLGLSIHLTGTPVNNEDIIHCIAEKLPFAMLWIMLWTYLILLVLLRSVFLPFKAILMNLLSLCACYGALVFIVQEGHFAHWLNFQSQGMLDISLLVIIFCALFGFSMDYEVFLLTRIKEFYEEAGDNNQSIICGIEKTGKIITSAALIVICICGSFLVADVLMVKAFGLGIAVAIFVDAFLIRTLLVPSTMVLLEQWNWYLPAWLNKVLPKN